MGVCVFFVKIENKWDEKKTEQKTWFYRFRFPDGHAHLLGREEKEREGSLWCMCSEQTLTITMSSFLFLPSLSVFLLLLQCYITASWYFSAAASQALW
jgi:hypothetical protein